MLQSLRRKLKKVKKVGNSVEKKALKKRKGSKSNPVRENPIAFADDAVWSLLMRRK